MLSQARLQTIIATCRLKEAQSFYQDVLQLQLRTTSEGALVFDVGGSDLRVSPVPSTTPSAHTIVGFAVADVVAAISDLKSRGVVFERLNGFPHDDIGTIRTPGGARVAWFRDPDDNLLSIVQFGPDG
ncbi:MAG: VOC family protein [Steroidobacteraceae bacterium]